MDALDSQGLSPQARQTLDESVLARVAAGWAQGRAVILNANKPGYSEAFTIQAAQYEAIRGAIHDAMHRYPDAQGRVLLKDVVAHVQSELGTDPLFPKGRMTNYTRYVKTDLEARGELRRVPKLSPQRVVLLEAPNEQDPQRSKPQRSKPQRSKPQSTKPPGRGPRV